MRFPNSLAMFLMLGACGASFQTTTPTFLHRSITEAAAATTRTTIAQSLHGKNHVAPVFSQDSKNTDNDLLNARFPTSVDDQIRQASAALQRASADGIHRHTIRLLLPVIGATELDDWPGGARQMMEAAYPLMQRVLSNLGALSLSQTMLDASDGVYALFSQAALAKDDACTVLLPSSDTVDLLQQQLEPQVGKDRNLILVNPQWKRRTDFGFFGQGDKVTYVESFVPSFSCTNLMVEGDQIRVLRAHPGPWRVFLRQDSTLEESNIMWTEIGQKNIMEAKPTNFDRDTENKRDGGKLFDYGQPSYRECEAMIAAMEGYRPKTIAEKAAASLTFIKDTL